MELTVNSFHLSHHLLVTVVMTLIRASSRVTRGFGDGWQRLEGAMHTLETVYSKLVNLNAPKRCVQLH